MSFISGIGFLSPFFLRLSSVCPLGWFLVMTPRPLRLLVYVLATLVDSGCQDIPEKGRWFDTKHSPFDSQISHNDILTVHFANLLHNRFCCDPFHWT